MYIYFFLERYPHGIFAAGGASVPAEEKIKQNLQQACFVSMYGHPRHQFWWEKWTENTFRA